MEPVQHRQSDETYRQAIGALRRAKKVLWWLILVALVVDLAIFFTVRFWSGLEAVPSLQAELRQMRSQPTPPRVEVPPPAIEPAEDEADETPSAAATPQYLTVLASLAQADALPEVEPVEPVDEPAQTADEVVDELLAPAPQPAEPATQPATPPTTLPASPQAPRTGEAAERFFAGLGVYLPLVLMTGLVSATLLMFVLMMAVKVALVGRLAGMGALMSSFLWSLLLLALVVPWQLAFPAPAVLPGVFFSRAELVADTAAVTWGAQAAWYVHLLYWLRYLVYPLVVGVVWWIVHRRFAQALREMYPPAPESPE